MKILRLVSRVIVGLVFIFSGTVKAIDPLGSAYKFHDYFQAFHLEFLQPMALMLAFLLCTAEFIAGVSVLTGYRQRTGEWLVLLLMIIFTPVTLVLAVSNPVSDCGCFGDAIHLTNWQTFLKNLVLLTLVLILFTGRKEMRQTGSRIREWSALAFTAVLFVIFSLMNLRYLPVIDFLPYKKGVNISENMKVPEGKPSDKYETTFIYEKEGMKKEFTIDNYPAADAAWKFVEQRSSLVKKGYQPPIHDFSIELAGGENITEQILACQGYTVLMISKKLHEAGKKQLKEGFDLGRDCISGGIGFFIVTASGSDETASYGNDGQFCTADETTLKTMMRSNPGYILLKGGTILGKWSWAGIPSKELFTENILKGKVEKLSRGSYLLYAVSLALSATVLFLLISSFAGGKTGSFEK
jgi:uncharacterized membrane protein YphA (DoxX/SURF4 family)